MTYNLLIFIIFFIGSSIFADEPLALITKSRGNAKYKISLESKYRSYAQVNTPLFNGNKIKTKAKSFAKIVYLDDRTTISVYPKTEVTINGTIENRMIKKQVDLTAGIVRVQVFGQLASEFKLTTPHSELTCYECDFWVVSDINKGEHFYKISGNGLVTNPTILKTLELANDSTIVSLKDTEMEIFQTPVTEKIYLESLMIDAGELPAQSEEELAMKIRLADQSPKTTSNIIEIRLKNALNIERTIILTYTK